MTLETQRDSRSTPYMILFFISHWPDHRQSHSPWVYLSGVIFCCNIDTGVLRDARNSNNSVPYLSASCEKASVADPQSGYNSSVVVPSGSQLVDALQCVNPGNSKGKGLVAYEEMFRPCAAPSRNPRVNICGIIIMVLCSTNMLRSTIWSSEPALYEVTEVKNPTNICRVLEVGQSNELRVYETSAPNDIKPMGVLQPRTLSPAGLHKAD